MASFLDHLTETAQPEKRWYVIHTDSGYEKKVKTTLEHRIETMGMEETIFQVLVPEEDEIESRGGQRVTVQKKVVPGYVLVEMILDPESWSELKKVTWPTREHVRNLTLLVFVIAGIFGVYIGVLDLIWTSVLRCITETF